MMMLTLFYDGTCPLCAKEMASLTKHDSKGVIECVDIYSKRFEQYSQIDPKRANTILHALDENGQLLLGLDAAQRGWQLVGKGRLYSTLQLPFIKPVADWCYLIFARNRYRISYLLTGQARCGCSKR